MTMYKIKSAVSVLALMSMTILVKDSVLACDNDPAKTTQLDLDIFNSQGTVNPNTGNRSIWGAFPPPGTTCTFADCPNPSFIFVIPVAGVPGLDPSGIVHTELLDFGIWHFDPDEWNPYGKNNADAFVDNPNTPFSKMLNSVYIINYGLKDDAEHSWHGTADYVPLGVARDNVYHSPFFRSVTIGTDDYNASFHQNIPGDDEITHTCRLFDHGPNDPVFRAAAMLHETWHAWENKNFHAGSLQHLAAPNGMCTQKAGSFSCDRFYPHTLETFRPFGTLNQEAVESPISWLPAAYQANDADPNKFHSPYQVQFEYLCDLADPVTAAAWVTMAMQTAAQGGVTEASQHFINGTPIQCGNNHPMIVP